MAEPSSNLADALAALRDASIECVEYVDAARSWLESDDGDIDDAEAMDAAEQAAIDAENAARRWQALADDELVRLIARFSAQSYTVAGCQCQSAHAAAAAYASALGVVLDRCWPPEGWPAEQRRSEVRKDLPPKLDAEALLEAIREEHVSTLYKVAPRPAPPAPVATGPASSIVPTAAEDWTIENLAARFGKSVETIRRWCRDKRPPVHNAYQLPGGDWRVPKADVPDE